MTRLSSIITALLLSSTCAQATQTLANGQRQLVTRVASNEIVVLNNTDGGVGIRLDINNQQILANNRIPHGMTLQLLCIDNRGCRLINGTKLQDGKMLYEIQGDYRLQLPQVVSKTTPSITSAPQRTRTVGEAMSSISVGETLPGQ